MTGCARSSRAGRCGRRSDAALPDISRARNLLDWEPRVPLAVGLERTIAYFNRLLGERGEIADNVLRLQRLGRIDLDRGRALVRSLPDPRSTAKATAGRRCSAPSSR